MKCSACGKEAVNGVVVCDTGPCLFSGKVSRFLTSDAACGLGPDGEFDPLAITLGVGAALLVAGCLWFFVFFVGG